MNFSKKNCAKVCWIIFTAAIATVPNIQTNAQPKTPTAEELNKNIPPYGGPVEEERVRSLIKRDLHDQPPVSKSTTVPKLPRLNHTPEPSPNGPPDEPDIIGLWNSNQGFMEMLRTNTQARQELEELMNRETSLPMKLLLASEAASQGSQRGALFLFNSMTNTDYIAAQNIYTAIRGVFYHYKENPPNWLVEMAIVALSDDRYATGLKEAHFSDDERFTLSYVADEDGYLTGMLGSRHCTNAVPFLIGMAKKTDGHRGPVMALGQMGDSRAIPLLIDLLKQKGPLLKKNQGRPLPDEFLRPVTALADLQATDAVPALLEYIEHPDVIEALQDIGDSRAIGPLQKLIQAKGAVKKTDVRNDPEIEQERTAAARIAVATLGPDDRTARLCELIAEPSFNGWQRRAVVWALADRPDPKAIPYLAKAIKTDTNGAVVNQAISVLAVFKYKAAVDALIDSFDANFDGENDWKRAYTPEMFRDNIAHSLDKLTGQKIVADKQQWLNWWKEHRDLTPDLK